MAKIGIDISHLHTDSLNRGIGFYVNNLYQSLKGYTKDEIVLINDQYKDDVDLIHYPYFDFFRLTLPLKKRHPTVVTVHDVIPLLFPQHYPPGIRGNIKKKLQTLSLSGVDSVITDSNASKEDIIKKLRINPAKINVIPLAPSWEFKVITNRKILEKTKQKFQLPKAFAVFVGSVNWNKNLINIAQGCIRAKLDLLLIGKDFTAVHDLNHPELSSFKDLLNLKNELIRFIGPIEQKELVNIMNLAAVTILASYYEGFGLPILEAQACGTPVITSNISSMPGVAGEGAILVDPHKAVEITDAINRVINDVWLKNKLIKKGFVNLTRYSWKKTAQETSQVYHRILDE